MKKEISYLIAVVLSVTLLSCGGGGQSVTVGSGVQQGETSLIRSAIGSVFDSVFLSLEHPNSPSLRSGDLDAHGSDIFRFRGVRSLWTVCLENEFEYVTATVRDSDSVALLTLTAQAPCAATEIQDEDLTLQIENQAPTPMHHFVRIEPEVTAEANQETKTIAEITTTIGIYQATTVHAKNVRLKTNRPLGYRSVEIDLLSRLVAELVVVQSYLTSGTWLEGEAPVQGQVLTPNSALRLGSYSDVLGAGTAGQVLLAGDEVQVPIMWDLTFSNDLHFSVGKSAGVTASAQMLDGFEASHPTLEISLTPER